MAKPPFLQTLLCILMAVALFACQADVPDGQVYTRADGFKAVNLSQVQLAWKEEAPGQLSLSYIAATSGWMTLAIAPVNSPDHELQVYLGFAGSDDRTQLLEKGRYPVLSSGGKRVKGLVELSLILDLRDVLATMKASDTDTVDLADTEWRVLLTHAVNDARGRPNLISERTYFVLSF